MGYHWNCILRDEHNVQFRHVCGQLEIPITKLMTRMFDYCLREQVLNEIVPAMSGQITLLETKGSN